MKTAYAILSTVSAVIAFTAFAPGREHDAIFLAAVTFWILLFGILVTANSEGAK